MRRASYAIIGTIAGTALLIGARLSTNTAGHTTATALGTDSSANGGESGADASWLSGNAQPAVSGRSVPGAGASRGGVGGSTPTAIAAFRLKTGTYTGTPATDKFGTVTVTITVSAGRMTNLSTNYNSNNENVSHASSKNAPMILRQEALVAQSANIAKVSGATFFSNSYTSSLQSALTKAHG